MAVRKRGGQALNTIPQGGKKNGSSCGGGLFTTMGGFHGYHLASVLVAFGHYKDSCIFILSSPGGGESSFLVHIQPLGRALSGYSSHLQPKLRKVTQPDT